MTAVRDSSEVSVTGWELSGSSEPHVSANSVAAHPLPLEDVGFAVFGILGVNDLRKDLEDPVLVAVAVVDGLFVDINGEPYVFISVVGVSGDAHFGSFH